MSLLLHILLVCYAPMQFGLAASEEPTTEGLTSTFLMDLTMIPHLDSLDSVEHGHLEAREPGILTTLLQAAQGSGFSSQENDESTILQSPQYFSEDGADGNDTSLDLGPPTDYTFPVSPGKSIPRGNESEPRDRWETATPQLSKDLADPVTHTTYTHAVAEEDAVLLMEQNHHTQANEMDLGDIHSPGSMEREDLLESTVSSSDPGTVGESVGEKDSREEEAVIEHTLNEMSELSPNPSLAPLSVSPPATYAGFVDIPARPPEKSTRLIVGRKHADGKGHEENVNYLSVPTDPHSFSDENSAAIMPSETEEHHTTAQHSRKGYRTTPPVPVKLVHASDVPLAESTSKPTKPNEEHWNSPQVICKDWSNLAGKNYIILNMSDDINCELFRLQKGQQLLSMVEDALSRKNDRLQESWVISLSKPNEHEKHLLMTLVGEDGVVPIKDVLMAMGDIRRNLAEIGIQNYSTTTSCHSRPSQSRSDYGKLFVVLVIIGSICVMIIVSGLIYICWQRRLPKLKNMSRGEELHFVENGCHDNPTLDVTMDSQSEMQEKKPSLNGGTLDGPDTWNILINKNAKEEPGVAEEDTHL